MRRLTIIAGVLIPLVLTTFVPSVADASTRTAWPRTGQEAFAFADGHIHRSPHQRPAPIASMAKVMTAVLVLQAHPLRRGDSGFRMVVTHRDVRDWRRRVARDESTVPVKVGERLSERQALGALLLPSANNVAIMLARKVAGSRAAFVQRMNRHARELGMTHTTYTDPSGFDFHTRSTARDQTVLARAAMHRATLRRLVALRRSRIPVAGRIYNTDTLLGRDGFAGIKTGSMDASGGCFMFVSHRIVHGDRVELYGAVMGRQGDDLIRAGLRAARRLVDRMAPTAG